MASFGLKDLVQQLKSIRGVGTDDERGGVKVADPTSLFGDLNTIERQTLVDTSSSFGTSVLRDETDATGSGSIVSNPNADGEIELGTGTTPDSTIDLRTAGYGRYTPGYSAQAGLGLRLAALWTEGEARWGYFTDTGSGNGFYFGYDGDQQSLFVARIAAGTEVERVYADDWNGERVADVLDEPLDPTKGYIYQIDFSWYGYGIINFNIVGQTADGISELTPRQETVTVHSIKVDDSTSIPDPNAPIRIELENGANGDDNRLALGGRQFSIFGEESQEQRLTSETVFDATYAADAWTHIMSWQRDGTGVDANARLDVSDLDITGDTTGKFALVFNADVSGLTYASPSLTPDDESLLAVSTAGTFNGIGSGRKVWEGSIGTGGTGSAPPVSLDVDANVNFGQNGTVSLLGFGDGSAGSGTVTMRLNEDW